MIHRKQADREQMEARTKVKKTSMSFKKVTNFTPKTGDVVIDEVRSGCRASKAFSCANRPCLLEGQAFWGSCI